MKEKGFFCIFSEDTAHLQLEEVYFLKKKEVIFNLYHSTCCKINRKVPGVLRPAITRYTKNDINKEWKT